MKELKLTTKNYVTVLQSALEVLREGGTVVYPTETSYGLGCDYYNPEAVAQIYAIKNRDASHPLPVIVPDLVSATYLVKFSEKARRFAVHYWPGPLTLVLPFNHSHWQKHFSKFLGLRVSSHPFANSLSINLGRPLVSTSANLSGHGDSYLANDVRRQFRGQPHQPDLFINAGNLPQRKPSTIIKCDGQHTEILRQGELKVKI